MFAHVLNCLRIAPVDSIRVREFAELLRCSLQTRLGCLLTEPNLALAACAIHPAFARLTFVTSDVRDRTLILLESICTDYDELSSYLELAGRDTFCPIRYWKAVKATQGYSSILHLPKILFSVQGTSAASERLFTGNQSTLHDASWSFLYLYS